MGIEKVYLGEITWFLFGLISYILLVVCIKLWKQRESFLAYYRISRDAQEMSKAFNKMLEEDSQLDDILDVMESYHEELTKVTEVAESDSSIKFSQLLLNVFLTFLKKLNSIPLVNGRAGEDEYSQKALSLKGDPSALTALVQDYNSFLAELVAELRVEFKYRFQNLEKKREARRRRIEELSAKEGETDA